MKKHNKTLCLLLSLLTALSLLFCAVPAAAAEEAPKNYVVLGDSIGFGAGIQNRNEAVYGKIIANTNGYAYSNYAVNGFRTEDLILRLKTHAGAIAAVKAADIISISIGGNNFLRDNMAAVVARGALGDYSLVDKIVDGVRTDFNGIMSLIRGYNPDVFVLMQTLYNPMEGTPLSAVYAEATRRLNTVYTDYAEAHPENYAVVDVAAAFRGKKGLIAADYTHPNAEGNYVIAQTVQSKLYELGVAQTDTIVIVTPAENWGEVRPASVWQRLRHFFPKLTDRFARLFNAG